MLSLDLSSEGSSIRANRNSQTSLMNHYERSMCQPIAYTAARTGDVRLTFVAPAHDLKQEIQSFMDRVTGLVTAHDIAAHNITDSTAGRVWSRYLADTNFGSGHHIT